MRCRSTTKAPFVGEFIEHLHNVLPGRGWWRLEDGDEAYWASRGEGSGTTVVSTLKRMRRGGSGEGETDLGGGAAKELRKMERTSAATGFLRQDRRECAMGDHQPPLAQVGSASSASASRPVRR